MTVVNVRHTEHEILDAMTHYGGNFVRQLAILYRAGDMENRRKLAEAFKNYFEQYDEMLTVKEAHGS